MNITAVKKIYRVSDRQNGLSDAMLRWLALFLGFFFVWVFMFVIAPWIAESPAVKPLARFIEDTGIDASALYYTEIDETAEAEMYLRDASTYSPGNRSKTSRAHTP